ncbi:MAG: hypothetical protein AAFX53_04805 [Bacteroidota bacterium]
MKLLGRLFDFYLDSNIHVALSVVALLWITSFYLDIPMNAKLNCFVFFATVSAYFFIRYVSTRFKYYLPLQHNHRCLLIFAVICSGAGLWCSLSLYWSPSLFLVLALLFLFTAAYVLPVLPSNGNLRDFGLLKIILVALVWAGVTVILPIINAQLDFSWDMGIEVLQRFILIVVLMLPFEVRDMKYDPPGLKTFPRRFGLGKTRMFGLGFVAFFFFLTFFKDTPGEYEPMTKGILSVFLTFLLCTMKRGQGKYFATFWVEAVPIFWGTFLWALAN